MATLPLLALSDGPSTGPKAEKLPKPSTKPPYQKPSKLSDAQRKYLEDHWRDDSWKKDLTPPETPAPPPDRVAWNQVKKSAIDEWAELQRAKGVARQLQPGEASSSESDVESPLQDFVPAPFVYPDPPPDPNAVVLSKDELKALTGDLSFDEVKQRLNSDKTFEGWQSRPKAEKETAVEDAKRAIRLERLEALRVKYFADRAKAEALHAEQQAAAQKAHDQKQSILKSQGAGASMLMKTEANATQKMRALLRIHFQKPGYNKKMRYWSKIPPPGRSQNPPVSDELSKKRKKWAIETLKPLLDGQIDALEFLLTHEFPPVELYIPNADVLPSGHPSLVVKPSNEIPSFAGTIQAVSESAQSSGAAVVFYVKRQEAAFAISNQLGDLPQFPPIGADFGILDETLRAQEKTKLSEVYDGFLQTLVDFDATAEKMFGQNEILQYTGGSGVYNRTLRMPFEAVKDAIPDKQATYSASEYEAYAKALYESIKKSHNDWEMGAFDFFKKFALRRIHSLWRILAMAPKLVEPVHAVRAVRDPKFLPHRLANLTDEQVQNGMAFLDTAFVSTAHTSPATYTTPGSQLAWFYNKTTNCCFMSLTIAAGTPTVPLFLKAEKLSFYKKEEEIVLPPLCVYVFRAKEFKPIGGKDAVVYHYDVYTYY